jgi:hypothetical protein
VTGKFSIEGWAIRLFVATLFIVGDSILLWSTMPDSIVDWVIAIVGFLVISALALDLAARYRIRDIYDAMVILAIVGLLSSLLISPQFSFTNFPSSLLTRVLGGHTLIAFEMFGLFIVLTAGQNRRYRLLMLAVAAWLGFYWGIWMRWTPVFTDAFDTVALSMMLSVAAIGFGAIIITWLATSRIAHNSTPDNLLMSSVEWFGILAILIALFLYQAFQNTIPTGAMIAIAVLLIVCWSIIWFRRDEKAETLLESHLPMNPLNLLWFVIVIAIFFGVTIASFNMPLVGTQEINQLWLMEIGFAAVGAIWLPLIAIVIAIRGIDYLMRTSQIT